ncbi:zinc-binding alcohol dehydrogenase [Paenibacillus sp. GD4]|uniref:zinc-dependent alcohol dehydrogenase n=1 Tax=Paenibacillus sp. GD4 TaxID=3068890 RepID=UPI002796B66D|nr:zinc-binding alcohol dehydrogenase [Paenibacillus sp. GD4]MDQ1913819.1 zinc-binding alcohol dehydrogenase [Paenibacillus sp. GD4]
MKTVAAQHGHILVLDKEPPALLPGHVIVRTEFSALSPGTELSMAKASKERPVYLGYSAVGIVQEVGDEVQGLRPGQRVACYGAPYVHHAELMSVPANLAAVVPEHVRPQEAALAGLGAIAVHAHRIADLRFGESVVVVGLGILGNLIAQIANAGSMVTYGYDLNPHRASLLQNCGVRHAYCKREALEKQIAEQSRGVGVDCVMLCASGSGQTLINDAMHWLRDRGKVVIVGDITAEFSRSLMFQKEAQVLISRAGGPGRYDESYERNNQDYPIGYVRWTEGRNIAEYIRLLADRRIQAAPLLTGTYPLEQAQEAYAGYSKDGNTIGTLLQY